MFNNTSTKAALYTALIIFQNARARGDADYLEVPHSCLRIGREIGKGAFGRVFMASAIKLPGFSGPKIVAIKQLKSKFIQTAVNSALILRTGCQQYGFDKLIQFIRITVI